jgi:hypothetical protein
MGDEETIEMSSQEVMAWLGDAERDRFVKFQGLFEADGWRLYREFALAKVFEHSVTGANAKTWEENRVAFGARRAWDDVAASADEFMKSFERLAHQNKMDAQPEADGP